MGIDNVPFYSILFPGSLLRTNEKYTLVSEIVSVHYLNFKGEKFSETDNHGIFGDEVMKKNVHPDYLMKIRAEDNTGSNSHQRGDANFTWRDFVDSCNADLIKKETKSPLPQQILKESNLHYEFSHMEQNLIYKCNQVYESNLCCNLTYLRIIHSY